MKEDILQIKIRKELDTLPIDTEARVLYLLVEIRKVLEHDNIHNGRYPKIKTPFLSPLMIPHVAL